jgi:hypothetical protein
MLDAGKFMMKSVTVRTVIISHAVLQKFGMFVTLAHHRLGHAIRVRHAGLSNFSTGYHTPSRQSLPSGIGNAECGIWNAECECRMPNEEALPFRVFRIFRGQMSGIRFPLWTLEFEASLDVGAWFLELCHLCPSVVKN